MSQQNGVWKRVSPGVHRGTYGNRGFIARRVGRAKWALFHLLAGREYVVNAAETFPTLKQAKHEANWIVANRPPPTNPAIKTALRRVVRMPGESADGAGSVFYERIAQEKNES